MATGHRSRRRDAADGRLRLGGDGHEVAEAGGRADRGRRAAARDLDRQGRHRGAEPRRRRRAEILVQEGETVEVGTKLAVIAPGAPRRGADAPAPERRDRRAGRRRTRPRAPERRRTARPEPPAPAAAAPAAPAPAATAATAGRSSRRSSPASPPSTASTRPRSPGTGRGGRVTKKDILGVHRVGGQPAAPRRAGGTGRGRSPARSTPPPPHRRRPPPSSSRPPPAAAPPPPRPPARPPSSQPGETLEPMTAMRRGIAEHMRRSLDTAAHVTSAIEVDMSTRRRDPREAEEGVPGDATASTRPTSRSSRAPPSRRCATTRGSTARCAATRSSRATTSTSASRSSWRTARG